MSKFLFPIFLVIISIGLVFAYIKPAYGVLTEFKVQESDLDKTITDTNTHIERYNTLTAQYNSISGTNRNRISKILPDAVDTVRLILDLDSLAAKHEIVLLSFEITDDDDASGGRRNTRLSTATDTPADESVGNAHITLTCEGEYLDFKNFIADIESNVNLMDMVDLSVLVNDTSQPGVSRSISYTLGLQTYWLK